MIIDLVGASDSWIYGTINGERRRLYYFENFDDRLGFEHNGRHWWRLSCSYQFGDWIEEQDKELWHIYGGRHRAIYIVREELMTVIKLKWR